MYNNSNNNGTTSASVDETIIEAAAPIIGGLILDSNAMTGIHDILDPKYFLLHCHKFIVQVIKNLHNSKKATDLMTMTMAKLHQIKGFSYCRVHCGHDHLRHRKLPDYHNCPQ